MRFVFSAVCKKCTWSAAADFHAAKLAGVNRHARTQLMRIVPFDVAEMCRAHARGFLDVLQSDCIDHVGCNNVCICRLDKCEHFRIGVDHAVVSEKGDEVVNEGFRWILHLDGDVAQAFHCPPFVGRILILRAGEAEDFALVVKVFDAECELPDELNAVFVGDLEHVCFFFHVGVTPFCVLFVVCGDRSKISYTAFAAYRQLLYYHRMTLDAIKKLNLPEAPGIYFFKKGKAILYIGRATSLRDRVRSYFADDLIKTRGPFIVDMVTQATMVEWQESPSVLESIILEANEIRKHKPKYNTKEKDDRSYNYVVITDEAFPRVILVRSRAIDMDAFDVKIKYKFGPYPQGGLLWEALVILRKIFPFRDAKSSIAHTDAFYRSLGLSPDTASPDAKKQYAKTIRNIRYFFLGKTRDIVKLLTKEMQAYAKAKEFEKAAAVRNTLYALEHIQDVALIKSDVSQDSFKPFRIEAYDVAHMSGKNVVGVMTVIENGEANKAEYRKFKMKKDANNDVGNLKEIISRRFAHPEWRMPDLIVVDGGEAQKKAAEKTLAELAGFDGVAGGFEKIPVVSVVKDERHKPKDILGTYDPVHKTNILVANSEAHRFAITYHRLRRGIIPS